MDLKFSFGGASPDQHDHGGAPSGIPLPFATKALASTSSVLELRARLDGDQVIGEALSGDGVAYTTSRVALQGTGTAPLAKATRSAISRAVAGLEAPMIESISALVLDLAGSEADVLTELGIAVDSAATPVATVDEKLQTRVGISVGTAIRFTE